MKSIPPIAISSEYIEFKMKINTLSTYVFCDVKVAFSQQCGLSDLGIKSVLSLPGSGVYEYNGLEFGIFKTQSGDGIYPFHEADDMNDPELVLLQCDSYFEDDEPIDNCLVDSGSIAFMPASLLAPGMKPGEVGPVVNFSRFDDEDYADSSVSVYCNEKGIYVIDYFLVRDLLSWKK